MHAGLIDDGHPLWYYSLWDVCGYKARTLCCKHGVCKKEFSLVVKCFYLKPGYSLFSITSLEVEFSIHTVKWCQVLSNLHLDIFYYKLTSLPDLKSYKCSVFEGCRHKYQSWICPFRRDFRGKPSACLYINPPHPHSFLGLSMSCTPIPLCFFLLSMLYVSITTFFSSLSLSFSSLYSFSSLCLSTSRCVQLSESTTILCSLPHITLPMCIPMTPPTLTFLRP